MARHAKDDGGDADVNIFINVVGNSNPNASSPRPAVDKPPEEDRLSRGLKAGAAFIAAVTGLVVAAMNGGSTSPTNVAPGESFFPQPPPLEIPTSRVAEDEAAPTRQDRLPPATEKSTPVEQESEPETSSTTTTTPDSTTVPQPSSSSTSVLPSNDPTTNDLDPVSPTTESRPVALFAGGGSFPSAGLNDMPNEPPIVDPTPPTMPLASPQVLDATTPENLDVTNVSGWR